MSKKTTSYSSNRIIDSQLKTFYHAESIDGNLVIPNLNTKRTSICVFSYGKEYREGAYRLKIGDTLYVISQKFHYYTFTHIKIVNLNSTDNCIIIYKKDIYNLKMKLPKKEYNFFLSDFRRRHDSKI